MNECLVDNNVLKSLLTKLDSKDIVTCFGMVCLSFTTICLGVCICKTKVCIDENGLTVNCLSNNDKD